jgi:hypothetical protein
MRRRESVRGGNRVYLISNEQTEDVHVSSCVFLLPTMKRACHANAPGHCCKLAHPIAANPNKVKDLHHLSQVLQGGARLQVAYSGN